MTSIDALLDEHEAGNQISPAQVALITAAEAGDVKRLTKLIRGGADLNAPLPGEAHMTVLHMEVINNRPDAVQLLIQAGAGRGVPDSAGRTAYHHAAIHGERDVMSALLHGARYADLNIQDEDGETAAHWAAWAGHAEVLDLLLKAKARTDITDQIGRTAWGRAHMFRQVECIRVLTAHGVRA
jgi:ankyrin repeat protein